MSELKCSELGATCNAVNPSKIAPSKVLHVHGLPSYTEEGELRRLVSHCGRVVNIFLLHGKHQAFIEMESIEVAQNALDYLRGNSTLGSKRIYFQFSKRSEITARPHDTVDSDGKLSAGPVLLVTFLNNSNTQLTLRHVFNMFQQYGDVLKIINFTKKGGGFQSLVQMATADAAIKAKRGLEGRRQFAKTICRLRIDFSKRKNLVVRKNDHKSRDFQSSFVHPLKTAVLNSNGGIMNSESMFINNGGMMQNGNTLNNNGGIMQNGMLPNSAIDAASTADDCTVVLVNKLNKEKINVDKLFILFGVYGDVMRVKILFNKRNTALIQYSNNQQARTAQIHLNGCSLYGQNIVVTQSRIREVRMPSQQQEDGQELTKDFTTSKFHRFKYKFFVNQRNVNAPSRVLHVANLHEEANEQELRDLFGEHQTSDHGPVIEFFKSSRRMAYVGMASVEDSINALINLHNRKLGSKGGGYPLRVSFSHKDPRALVDSEDNDD